MDSGGELRELSLSVGQGTASPRSESTALGEELGGLQDECQRHRLDSEMLQAMEQPLLRAAMVQRRTESALLRLRQMLLIWSH